MAHLNKLIRYSEEKLDKLKQIEEVTVQQKAAIDSQDSLTARTLRRLIHLLRKNKK